MGRLSREVVPVTQTKSCELGIVLVVGLCWLAWMYALVALPNTTELRTENPVSTSFMRRNGAPLQHAWVSGDHLSPFLARAVVAAEDDQFFEHPGFDWAAIRRAIRINWARREFAFGGSTITQQVAKNLYLSPAKNPLRKVKELLIALKLERDLGKHRILEIYLNVVEWGDGIYGAEAAAQHYFGRAAGRVSPEQAAFLASILPNPRVLGSHGFRMTNRARAILRRM